MTFQGYTIDDHTSDVCVLPNAYWHRWDFPFAFHHRDPFRWFVRIGERTSVHYITRAVVDDFGNLVEVPFN